MYKADTSPQTWYGLRRKKHFLENRTYLPMKTRPRFKISEAHEQTTSLLRAEKRLFNELHVFIWMQNIRFVPPIAEMKWMLKSCVSFSVHHASAPFFPFFCGIISRFVFFNPQLLHRDKLIEPNALRIHRFFHSLSTHSHK